MATWRFSLVSFPIDLAHPSHAEQRGDFVDAEAGAGREGHHLSTLSSIQMLPVA